MVNIIHQKSENTSNVNCRIYNSQNNTINDKNSPENADPYQVEVFSNAGAELFAQNFLEKKLNTIVSIKLKFTGPAKISKFSDVSPEFAKHVIDKKQKYL